MIEPFLQGLLRETIGQSPFGNPELNELHREAMPQVNPDGIARQTKHNVGGISVINPIF